MSGNPNYRVVVAEDELPILENIVDKIHSLDFCFTVVGTATNGEDALEIIKQQQPHILFTDIRMPIMDGLELIKNALLIQPNLKIVIISGYDEFEYAQKAIRYGVTDYLLKPVKLARLSETAQKLYDSLRQSSAISEREIIASGLSGRISPHDLPSELSGTAFSMHLICLGNRYDRCHDALNIEAINALWNKMNPQGVLNKMFGDSFKWWLADEKYPNCKMLIAAFNAENLGEVLYSTLRAPLEQLFPITVCSTSFQINFSEIWKVAQELRLLLQNNLRPCVSSYIPLKSNHATQCYTEYEENSEISAIELACKNGQFESAKRTLACLLQKWQQLHITQCSLEKQLFSLLKKLTEIGSIPSSDFALIEAEASQIIAENTEETTLYSELEELVLHHINVCFQPNDTSEEIYFKIKKYLDENYHNPITVDSIAENFHFSSSYISRIFKKHSGLPPFRYLLTLRINEAKRLIEENEGINFCLISEMVGYPDPHYFSRIFKNMTGLSPSDYKNKHFKDKLE